MRPHTAAFTILEIMIGMSILAIGLMATSSAMFTSINAQDSSHERDLALQAIEITLEGIFTGSFASAPGWIGNRPVPGLQAHPDSGQGDVLAVTMEDFGSNPDLRLITLRAEWDHRSALESMEVRYIHTKR